MLGLGKSCVIDDWRRFPSKQLLLPWQCPGLATHAGLVWVNHPNPSKSCAQVNKQHSTGRRARAWEPTSRACQHHPQLAVSHHKGNRCLAGAGFQQAAAAAAAGAAAAHEAGAAVCAAAVWCGLSS